MATQPQLTLPQRLEARVENRRRPELQFRQVELEHFRTALDDEYDTSHRRLRHRVENPRDLRRHHSQYQGTAHIPCFRAAAPDRQRRIFRPHERPGQLRRPLSRLQRRTTRSVGHRRKPESGGVVWLRPVRQIAIHRRTPPTHNHDYSNRQHIAHGLYTKFWGANGLTVGADYMHDYLNTYQFTDNASHSQTSVDAFVQFDYNPCRGSISSPLCATTTSRHQTTMPSPRV